MTGSLTIKNGKYYAVLNVYENGKRKKSGVVPTCLKRATSAEQTSFSVKR